MRVGRVPPAFMKIHTLVPLLLAPCLALSTARAVDLIAVGAISGTYQDFSVETAAPLENGVAGNLLGGLGSGFTYAGGDIFLALPDRGPNANPYNSVVDDTVSFIPRIQTLHLSLMPVRDPLTGLPFTLTPMLVRTTLLSSRTPLAYGTGAGLGFKVDGTTPIGSGAPALNAMHRTHYFSGRSDNFDPSKPSTNPNNARLDPEGIRVSNDGRFVYISDEYGPYIHEFDRETGVRIRSFALPANLGITTLSPHKDAEIAGNSVGRVTNKGMEGLAITPDGRTLVGIMQGNLEQDQKKGLRIVTVDVRSGATHEYAYKLTDGSGVSEIVAVNHHQFLVDERDGRGMGDAPLPTETASSAVIKRLFLIDLDGATDVTNIAGPGADLSAHAVTKTLFLDIVAKLTAAGFDARMIPSKIEGLTFGQDVSIGGVTKHTLYVTNDNDFLATIADPRKLPSDPTRGMVTNPNQFFVFAIADSELPGYVPQPFHHGEWSDDHDHDRGR